MDKVTCPTTFGLLPHNTGTVIFVSSFCEFVNNCKEVNSKQSFAFSGSCLDTDFPHSGHFTLTYSPRPFRTTCIIVL